MILDSIAEDRVRTPDARREAFVAAARAAFFANGYAATSMSAISATVGGSKTTLWTYFPSKQDLFAAVLDDLIERYGTALEVRLDPDGDVRTELRRYAEALMDTLHSPPIIDMHRLVIGEAGRFPELGRMMYERGEARGKAQLRAFVQAAMAAGKLRSGDVALAVALYSSMIKGGSAFLHLLGIAERQAPADRTREIEGVIDTFLQAWAARPA